MSPDGATCESEGLVPITSQAACFDAIAEENGVKMPSFFGYMAWSVVILVPVFIVVSLIYFAAG